MTIGVNTTFHALLNGNESDKLVYYINGVENNNINITAGIYNVTVVFAGNSTHKGAQY